MHAVRPVRPTDLAHLQMPRDLACPELWERSMERSRRRRQAAEERRPGLQHASAAKVSAALVTATLAASGAHTATAAKSGTAAQVSVPSLLRAGSTGDAVRAVQAKLGVSATGTFGPATARAVRAFQRRNGLTVDGIVGPQTARALGLTSGPAGGRERAGLRTVSSPSSGALDRATVRALQRAVGVRADGVVGPRTRAAIRRAERRLGLEADGRPDARLLAALGVGADGAPDGSAPAEDETAGAPAPGQGAAAAVAAAQAKVGASYASGGNGPGAFDCSGLTVFAFRAAGISLPRTSYDQYGQGTRVAKGDIQAGDLVFFSTNGSGASHVGIATSPTTAISATTRGVREHSFASGYWAEHYVGARRVA